MRLSVRFLLLLLPILIAVAFGFNFVLDRLERGWLASDLEHRSSLLSTSIHDTALEAIESGESTKLERLIDRLGNDSRLLGVSLCNARGEVIRGSERLPVGAECGQAGAASEFFTLAGETIHRVSHPVVNEAGVEKGVITIFQDPSYMTQRSGVLRWYALLALLGLGIFSSAATLLLYRRSVSLPIQQLASIMKSVLKGKGESRRLLKGFKNTELEPLLKNVDKILNELKEAKLKTFEAVDSIWNPARLRHEVQRLFDDSKLCVVANREPYIHNKKGTRTEVLFPASGLVSAVEPIVRACSGLWIGHGSGTADRENSDENGVLLVPPGKPEYALKRVWLTKEEEQGYYYGFSNEGLWPLCHIAHARPNFRREDWEHYQRVNQKFADAFQEQMKAPRPIALIQDYHYALLPGMLRQMRPDAVTSLFWHIPWPNPEVIGICPWKNEILKGMLGANLIGFHTQYHCNNFLDTVDRFLEARVERHNHSVTIQGHTCYVKPFPISIEWPPRHDLAAEEIPQVRAQLLEEIGLPQDIRMGIGVDRLDYTKGIVERFLAVERLLEKHPELVGRFVFVQIGAPSRTHIKRYQDLNSEVQEVASRINWRFGDGRFEPIMLRLAHHNAEEVFRFYRAADVCYVSSLHDGMNLVAKEYIASRSDLGGALVLSSFTGAAGELKDALIVNPYDVDESADALYQALVMQGDERAQRMGRLRNTVAANNVYQWAGHFLAEVHAISQEMYGPDAAMLSGLTSQGGSNGVSIQPRL